MMHKLLIPIGIKNTQKYHVCNLLFPIVISKILTKNLPTPNVCFASLRAAKAALRYASRGAFRRRVDGVG